MTAWKTVTSGIGSHYHDLLNRGIPTSARLCPVNALVWEMEERENRDRD